MISADRRSSDVDNDEDDEVDVDDNPKGPTILKTRIRIFILRIQFGLVTT